MIRSRVATLFLSAALLVAMPAAVNAQPDPITPESESWVLTGYLDAEVLASVPFGVEATLELEDGTVSGSGGCNSFSGSYQLDGTSLTFGQDIASTLMSCVGEAQVVEDAYLALLPQVATWSISHGALALADGSGSGILTFELPTMALTESQLSSLIAELQQLRGEIETLRADMEAPRSPTPVATPTPAATAPPAAVALNRAEKVLLEGVVPRIAKSCVPLRRNLPTGAVAAVECSPNTTVVREMAYYLMDQPDAARLFSRKMRENGVRGVNDIGGQCSDGLEAVSDGPGPGSYAEGCFVDTNGRANLRYLQTPTECKVLRAGGRRLATPVIYVAITGQNRSVKRLTKWTQRGTPPFSGRYNQISGLTQEIKRPSGAWSPGCPVR